MEFEDEVDLLMSGDIISAQVSTKPISFNKAKAGWIFREDSEFAANFETCKNFGQKHLGSLVVTFHTEPGMRPLK